MWRKRKAELDIEKKTNRGDTVYLVRAMTGTGIFLYYFSSIVKILHYYC